MVIDQPEPGDDEVVLSTVRHGLTELNRDQRVGGRTDAPLIDEGREQAREARQRFAGTDVDVVIASPLSRARETARIVANLDDDRIEIDEACVERSFGEMEGMRPQVVSEQLPQVEYLHVDGVGYSLNPPGGETFDELRARAVDFLEGVRQRHRGRRVVVFAHENFLQQLHGAIRGNDPLEALSGGILNCELHQFHLGSDGELLGERSVELCPSAADHPSF